MAPAEALTVTANAKATATAQAEVEKEAATEAAIHQETAAGTAKEKVTAEAPDQANAEVTAIVQREAAMRKTALTAETQPESAKLTATDRNVLIKQVIQKIPASRQVLTEKVISPAKNVREKTFNL